MKNLFLYGILFTLLAASGCRKDCVDPADPECSNYDPCTGYVVADAGFRILEIPIYTLGWDCGGQEPRDLEFEVDSVFGNGRTIYFRADQETASSYEWKVGTDPRAWTTREFNLDFAQNAVGDVPIKLIVEKDNPLSCGGVAVSRDTLTKTLHVMRPPAEYPSDSWSPIYGKWSGHNEDQSGQNFEIEIIPNFLFARVNNLLPGCIDREMRVGVGWKFMYIDGRGQSICRRVCGIGLLQDGYRTLVIDYNYQDEASGERVSRKFIGQRVE
jgi:hypothetical protein